MPPWTSSGNDSSPKPRRGKFDEFSGDKSRNCCDRSPRTTCHLGWKRACFLCSEEDFIFSGPGRGRKARLIFLETALLKLSISHHPISFSLSSDLFYWMVTREPRCLKLTIHRLDLVFYLLKNISIAQNLWQYVGNTDGKNMTLISLSALFKK